MNADPAPDPYGIGAAVSFRVAAGQSACEGVINRPT